jgi:putative glycosyltransferase (TIGR04372 family)
MFSKCLIKFFLNNFKNIFNIIINIFYIKNKYKREFNQKYIVLLSSQAIGPMAQFAELAFRHCRNYNINLSDVIFISPSSISNQQLFKMINNKVNIVVDDKLYNTIQNGGYLYLKYLGIYIMPIRHENGLVYSPNQETHFSFTKEEEEFGSKLLKKLDIQPNDKIVIVHNKDDYYWAHEKGQVKNHDIYRNSNFETLYESINALQKQNYKVVRIGHYKNEKNHNYISLNDLSKNEKDFMDIYINYKATFSITGDSGIALISYIFKTPLIMHNCIPMGESPIFENAIIIPKIMKDKNNNILSLKNILSKKQLICYNSFGFYILKTISAEKFQNIQWYINNEITVQDNSENEILNAVNEMVLFVNNELILNNSELEIQSKFKKTFPLNHPMRHFIGYISPSHLNKYNIVKD